MTFFSFLLSFIHKSVSLMQRVHPFPFRTRKLSSVMLKILDWRRSGKIGRCRHYLNRAYSSVFSFCSILAGWNREKRGRAAPKNIGSFFSFDRWDVGIINGEVWIVTLRIFKRMEPMVTVGNTFSHKSNTFFLFL